MHMDTLLIDVGSVTLNFAQPGATQICVAMGMAMDNKISAEIAETNVEMVEINVEMQLHKIPDLNRQDIFGTNLQTPSCSWQV